MRTSLGTQHLSRRAAVAGLGAGGIGVALAARGAVAQDAPVDFSGHPMTGMWLAMANPPRAGVDSQTPVPSLFAAEGTCILKASEDGVTFSDDGSLVTVTIRDAAGAVVVVIPPNTDNPPTTGVRMRVGNPGFPGEQNATPVP